MSAIMTQGTLGDSLYPVEITPRGDGGYDVFARATQLSVYLKPLDDGNLLVSVPDIHRCGSVPADPTSTDIEMYCDIENRVDAASIAAAVSAIRKECKKA